MSQQVAGGRPRREAQVEFGIWNKKNEKYNDFRRMKEVKRVREEDLR